ncbi:hypothetical protein LXM50_08780 [Microbacterium sp. Au-Mic1]|uniref:hypothetical protein n=1 Tax=Microbacterium sp. Au-Mic1 TaxID=2906457 RepID=UPI001E2E662A|nr:hypothetical protein [Microbacterium sp. Au-Mic1]MCE4026067.1 hypothetical protein [Microbacterium sp. Au-Mic1]
MQGRTWSLRGFVPGAIAGGFLALGWVALSIAFGSGSAQAAETAPPPPPSIIGALQSTVGAVQNSITEGPVTVQSTLSAVQTSVSEVLPAPVADAITDTASVSEAGPAPAEVSAPAAPLIAPIVETVLPVVQGVDQTAGAAIDAVTTTADTVAPALSPVLAPVNAVLHRVPTTLDAVTAALPRIAVSVDGTVGTVTETVRGATALVPSPSVSDPVGAPTVPAPQGTREPVSSASIPPVVLASARDGAQPALPAVDDVLTAALSAPPAATAPAAPARHPSGSPTSEFGVPGTGSASGGSTSDVRLFGTISSLSAGDRLLTVRTGSAGDDRLPVSPVADHDSSPD